jgi:hypothetical protein
MRLAKATVEAYSEAVTTLLKAVARRLAQGIDEPGWAGRKLAETVRLRDQAVRQLERLHTVAPRTIRDAIKAGYKQGGADAKKDLVGLKIEPLMVRTHTAAMDVLIHETVTNVTATHPQILRTVLDVYRSVIAETATPQVVSGAMTTRQAAQSALDRFANIGVTGFQDTAGRNWQLDSYVEMATRTSVGRAQVAGTLDRFVDAGRDLVIVSEEGGCPVCEPWEGEILSISGDDPDYSSVDEAEADGLFHPNCTHSLGAYVDGLTEPMPPADEANTYEARQEQRYLERGVRQWSRREAVALDDRAAQQAASKVGEWRDRLVSHIDDNDLKRLSYREVG